MTSGVRLAGLGHPRVSVAGPPRAGWPVLASLVDERSEDARLIVRLSLRQNGYVTVSDRRWTGTGARRVRSRRLARYPAAMARPRIGARRLGTGAGPSRSPRDEASMSTGMGPGPGWLLFRRIVDVPFETCVAALEQWQRTGDDGGLHLGESILCGPLEHNRGTGTCRIQARLARGPLRPPLPMRLNIDRWSASATAVELVPSRRVKPTAAYFRAGHRLIDALARWWSVAACQPARTPPSPARSRPVPAGPGRPRPPDPALRPSAARP